MVLLLVKVLARDTGSPRRCCMGNLGGFE